MFGFQKDERSERLEREKARRERLESHRVILRSGPSPAAADQPPSRKRKSGFGKRTSTTEGAA